jgi:ketosteroid isomerase-like protein
MNVANRVVNDEGQVRGVIDSWVQALRAKDVDGLVKHYAADVRSFDIAPPLQSRGTDATRAGLKSWFQSWRGPIGYEVSDLGNGCVAAGHGWFPQNGWQLAHRA